jgi:hypothetical protein
MRERIGKRLKIYECIDIDDEDERKKTQRIQIISNIAAPLPLFVSSEASHKIDQFLI